VHEFDGSNVDISEVLIFQERFEFSVLCESEEVRSGRYRRGRTDADLVHGFEKDPDESGACGVVPGC
jgi:hypothetical protein